MEIKQYLEISAASWKLGKYEKEFKHYRSETIAMRSSEATDG